MAESRFVNIGLLSSPLNWISILIWVMVLGYLIHTFDPQLRNSYPKGN